MTRVLYHKNCQLCSSIFTTYKADKKYCSKKCNDKQYSIDNKDKKKQYDIAYYAAHADKKIKASAKWRQDNKHLRWEKEKRKLKENPKLNFYKNILTVMGSSIKKGRISSYNKTFKMLGYSLDQLIERLKSTTPIGYTWDDFRNGKLHIDHIKPHSLFNYTSPEDDQFKECWSLNNLRLLQKEINIKRQNKYEPSGCAN